MTSLNFFSGGLSTQFINGEFLFLLNGDSTETYDVQLTRDGEPPFPWYRVTGKQYTVKNALLYDSIRVNVSLLDNPISITSTYKGILYIFINCNSFRITFINKFIIKYVQQTC